MGHTKKKIAKAQQTVYKIAVKRIINTNSIINCLSFQLLLSIISKKGKMALTWDSYFFSLFFI